MDRHERAEGTVVAPERAVQMGPARRLAVLPDGRIAYSLKTRWRDGSTHVVLDPMTFLERLCALVPRPHKRLVTYHGVFAPAAGYRDRVVPERTLVAPCRHLPSPAAEGHEPPTASEAHATPPPRRPQHPPHVPRRRKPPLRRRNYPWAELRRRVFGNDVLVCPFCHGPRRLLAFLTDPSVVRSILAHLGLPTEARNRPLLPISAATNTSRGTAPTRANPLPTASLLDGLPESQPVSPIRSR